MKLYGKIFKEAKIIREALVEREDGKASYRDLLEGCLIDVCRELEIPVPLWLKKNTSEYAAYRRTFFSNEQFVEKVTFDKFEIYVE
ncbi:MAG: hypothetical protein N2645_16260 [Clostridia bacterium]|nr:hypothetical protein [Clostridia bacterium]